MRRTTTHGNRHYCIRWWCDVLPFGFLLESYGPLAILCLGAHADDIEIGAGGTILTLLERHPGSRVLWVVFSAKEHREAEARGSATAMLGKAANAEVAIHQFRDGFFPSDWARIKQTFEGLKPFAPNVILTHYKADHHQDHRIISELTWNTFRDHLVFEYEVLKYDPDLGNPNLFVPLSQEKAETKLEVLWKYFTSQRQKRWFTSENFMAMMRVRGAQAASPSGLAEGFYVSKCVLHG
jgi:LmbE family N-acetylglucosaminyl deacetylase